MPTTAPARDLKRFIDRYTPDIARLAPGSLKRMRKCLPAAHQLVSDLQDTQQLLQGSGSVVRFIPLDSAAQIDSAPVQRLMKQALAAAKVPLNRTGRGKLIIKAISARQRPRRP
jgi:hypothetical protein